MSETAAPIPPEEDLELTPKRLEALDLWARDKTRWSFLTGLDPETQKPMVWTTDRRNKATAVGEKVIRLRAFPKNLTYVRLTLEILAAEQFVVITKARRMFLTNLVCGLIYGDSLFEDRSRAAISKYNLDEAKDIIKTRIRQVHELTPAWFQKWAKLSPRPATRIDVGCSGSTIHGVAQNLDVSSARGDDFTTVAVDEAEYQDRLEAILTAAAAGSLRTILLSTPNPGTEGARVFEKYLDMDSRDVKAKDHYRGCEGMRVRRTTGSHVIIEVDYWADPNKNEKWAKAQQVFYPEGETAWRREMLRDRTVLGTKPYFPEFRPEIHIKEAPRELPNLPVDRGWDFGTVALTFSQYSPTEDLFWALRELCPVDCGLWDFCALVKYVSGEWEEEQLEEYPRACQILEALRKSKQYPEPPWFAPGTTFRDYAGHEANKPATGLSPERREKTDADIVRSFGINLNVNLTRVARREQVMRRLLTKKPNGTVGFLSSPACYVLNKALAGGLERDKRDPRKWQKGKGFDHVWEALAYPMSEVVPTVAENQPGVVDPGPESTSIGLHEAAMIGG